jgi:hypothetical protein
MADEMSAENIFYKLLSDKQEKKIIKFIADDKEQEEIIENLIKD